MVTRDRYGMQHAHPTPLPLTVFEVISNREVSPTGIRRVAGDGLGCVWVDTPVRHRPYYVCSAGVEHRRWWRRHAPLAADRVGPAEFRCIEHEVIESIDPDLVEI